MIGFNKMPACREARVHPPKDKVDFLLVRICLLLLVLCPCVLAQTASEALFEGNDHFNAGRFEEAARAFSLALEREPSSGEAYAGLIRTLLKQEKISQAAETIQKAFLLAEHEPAVHAAAGDLYFRKGQFALAEAEYKEALRLNNEFARAWWGVGRVADIQSMHKTAKDAYETAFKLDPNDPELVLGRAHHLSSRAEVVGAIESYISLARNADPDVLEGVRNRLEALRRLGDRKTFVLASPYVSAAIPLQPLRDRPGRLVGFGLDVSLNGGKAKKFLLDTGASGITINRSLAKKLRVKRLSSAKLHGVGDASAAEGYHGLIESVRIGDVEFRDCLVVVSEWVPRIGVDGIIGPVVFGDFLVTIDFPKQRFLLDPFPGFTSPPSREEAHDPTHPPHSGSRVVVFSFGHQLLVPTKVNDSPPVLFLLDTGAYSTMISTSMATERAKLKRQSNIRVGGFSGEVEKVFTADAILLQFGRFVQQNQDVISFDFSRMNKLVGTEVSGALGFPLLNLFRLTIDYRNGFVEFDYPLARPTN